jgi:hypothetical protein
VRPVRRLYSLLTIQSSGYPSADYDLSESCTVTNLPALPARVVAFDVKDYGCQYDYLTIGGRGSQFCGTLGPYGIVASDGRMTWTSDDFGAFSGWKDLLRPGSAAASCIAAIPAAVATRSAVATGATTEPFGIATTVASGAGSH